MSEQVDATEKDAAPAADVTDTDGVGLSPAAVERVRALLKKEGRPDGAGLRVGVANGGCSGMSYTLGFDDAPTEKDLVSEFEGGVRMFVDRENLQYLEGTVVDFADGLHGAGFKFTNPNADRTCGCGTSFSV
ncbi:MAG: iron-sulfur cluster assembly accessory protein [Candidatus Binatia bacterium]|nr:iron-sulfur cluster assembly accessory protein [Candidatus Binatia bacterium]